MTIHVCESGDLPRLAEVERHISRETLALCVAEGRVLLAEEGGGLAGWLRYGFFWDSVPFLNMLYVLEEHRGKGIGRALMTSWEEQMRARGFRSVLTSTASDEYAQHFYEKLGYRAVGGFLLPGDPYELLMRKEWE